LECDDTLNKNRREIEVYKTTPENIGNASDDPSTVSNDYFSQRFSYGLILRLGYPEILELQSLLEKQGIKIVFDKVSLDFLYIVDKATGKKV